MEVPLALPFHAVALKGARFGAGTAIGDGLNNVAVNIYIQRDYAMSNDRRYPVIQPADNSSGLFCVLWAAALLFAAIRLVGISNTYLHVYDEGSDYYGAMLASTGLVPYADYFYAHPPGLLVATAVAVRSGLGLGDLRIIHCLLGILLPIGAAFLTAQFVSDRWSLAPPLTALLVAISELYQNHSRHVLPDVPAVTLMLFAAGFFFRPSYWSPCQSAVLLAVALLFKLQAAVILPWLGLSAIVFFGWRDGSYRLLRFALTLAFIGGAVFAALSLTIPRFFDCVVAFQARRPRLPLIERSKLAREALLSLELGLGLVMAALQLVLRDPKWRCLGLSTLVVAAGITFGANSLYDYYYFYLLPFAAASTAVMLTLIAGSGLFPFPRGTIAVASGMFIVLLGPTILARVSETTRHQKMVNSYKEWLADLPGDQLLTTDPAILILGRKRAVPDYFAADPGAAALTGQFDTWIARTVDRADVVVVNDRMLYYIGPGGIKAIRASGKPIRFRSPDNQSRWRELIETVEVQTEGSRKRR